MGNLELVVGTKLLRYSYDKKKQLVIIKELEITAINSAWKKHHGGMLYYFNNQTRMTAFEVETINKRICKAYVYYTTDLTPNSKFYKQLLQEYLEADIKKAEEDIRGLRNLHAAIPTTLVKPVEVTFKEGV